MIADKLSMILLFGAALALNSVAYLAVVARGARSLRLAVEGYTLGFGPVVLRRGTLTVRLIPLTASFMPVHWTMLVESPPEIDAAIERGELRRYDDLPRVAQYAFLVVSPVASILAAAILLGPNVVGGAIVLDLRDYVVGVLGPLSDAPRILGEGLRAYQNCSLGVSLGRSFAAVSVLTLLTLPNTLLFLPSMRDSEHFWPKIRALIVIVNMMTGAIWCIGVTVWLLGA